jgi:hypothetical protein
MKKNISIVFPSNDSAFDVEAHIPDSGKEYLVFHRPHDRWTCLPKNKGWQFTHTNSGLGIGITADRIKDAREILEYLDLAFDWNFEDLGCLDKPETDRMIKEVVRIKKKYKIGRFAIAP